ncbi:MAG: 2-keto-4-pentenoate hydratase [Acidimicrobiales bacterium]
MAEVASRLYEAEASRTPIAPIRDAFGAGDLSTAYAVQLANVERGIAAGRRVVGRKIGLTNPAVQTQLGVDQPDFGTLFADMAYADGVEIDSTRLIQPRVEAEVALVLAQDLAGDQINVLDLLRATAYALPALEIVDSRISDWDIRITDTIADNGSSALFVVGNSPVPLDAVDLRSISMSMRVNDQVVSEGGGAACLDNPLHAAIWLANAMVDNGSPLRAGDVVLTGALGPMVSTGPGDQVVAEMTGLGTVHTAFSAD